MHRKSDVSDLRLHHGDKIDLLMIDADTGSAGDQMFTFVGTDAFTNTPGELRIQGGGFAADVRGDSSADFLVHLNTLSLLETDFIL